MGARPLRRAIQRYIEDPLADEVLKAGPESIETGTTVLVSRDESGDDEDQPLKLELIPPSKPVESGEEKQPVGVGAKGSGKRDSGEEHSGEEPAADGGEAAE
jgi:ATP-dependent Clp protease ATP-binding subunit ClpC